MFSFFTPLYVSIGYIATTIVLHYFGPWTYRDEQPIPALLFMGAALALFAAGYFSETPKRAVFVDWSARERNFRKFYRLAKLGLFVQLALILAEFWNAIGDGSITFSWDLNLGKIYREALLVAREDTRVSLVRQIRVMFSPLFYLSSAYLLFCFPSLGKRIKIVLVSTLVLICLFGIFTKGAQKDFGDLFILFISSFFLRCFGDRRKFAQFIKSALVFLSVAVALFFAAQISRMAEYDALDFSGTYYFSLDKDGLLFSLFGDRIGLGVALLVHYLTAGYYGLSLCLQLPFEWTHGVGSSFALSSYAQQYLGFRDMLEASYPYRMENVFGYPAKSYWHTVFPWLASDLSFLGAALLMYLVGKALARSMLESVRDGAPLAITMFYFMVTFVIFIPANNQLMQERYMTVGFLVICICWVVTCFSAPRRRSVRARNA